MTGSDMLQFTTMSDHQAQGLLHEEDKGCHHAEVLTTVKGADKKKALHR